MLSLPPSVKIYVGIQPVDMRRSFSGLANVIQHELHKDPRCGHLFCFFNRRGYLAKLLFWDRSGFCIIAKRLEKGRFRLPTDLPQEATEVEIESTDLLLLLEGIDLRGAHRRPKWKPTLPRKLTSEPQNDSVRRLLKKLTSEPRPRQVLPFQDPNQPTEKK